MYIQLNVKRTIGNHEITTSFTYCGRTKAHEMFSGWWENEVDAEIKFWEIWDEVNLGHLKDCVHLPRIIPIRKISYVMDGRTDLDSLRLKMDTKWFGWTSGVRKEKGNILLWLSLAALVFLDKGACSNWRCFKAFSTFITDLWWLLILTVWGKGQWEVSWVPARDDFLVWLIRR